MNTDLRRSKRFAEYLALEIFIKNGTTGKFMAGPFKAHIINISRHGACLLLSQVMLDRYHVFHSTMENDSHLLVLNFVIPPDDLDVTLPARPVWFDLFRHRNIRAFKMGIEFLIHPEGEQMRSIQKAMRKQQQERGRWWMEQVHSGTI